MPVSQRMREIESEIDQAIKGLPAWNAAQEALLNLILNHYRDAIEVVFLRAAWAIQFRPDELVKAFALEHYLHAGVFQVLKWAMEFSAGSNSGQLPDSQEIKNLIDLGKNYENFVDALKMANYDQVAISIDDGQKIITVYEGGDLTGADAQLVIHRAQTLPVYTQTPSVEDGDQITLRWSAGDFRGLMQKLSNLVSENETQSFVSTFPDQQGEMFKRPVLLDIPDCADPAQQAALEDITLTPAKVEGAAKWKLTSWLDIPCLMIGSRRVAPSNAIKALAGFGGDDYMLRIAARVDQDQYSRVSGMRESRMIAFCEEKLRAFGWDPHSHYRLTDPPREIDIYATRASSHLVLQLKSTLRPETPWEVFKRNEDIVSGISHTAEVVPHFPEGTFGFVITDGYRGDYFTWVRSLRDGVMVGSLSDIEVVAEDPQAAIETLKLRAGFDSSEQSESLPTRAFNLFDWTIRLVDEAAP